VHTVPQAPQLLGSKWAGTQSAPQSIVFAPHAAAQAPFVQTFAPQADAHVPQLFGSSSGLMQVPLQRISGNVHVTAPVSVASPPLPPLSIVPPESGVPPESFAAASARAASRELESGAPSPVSRVEESLVLTLPSGAAPSASPARPPFDTVPLQATTAAEAQAATSSADVKRLWSMVAPPSKPDARPTSIANA
jgi:hypothetical protein